MPESEAGVPVEKPWQEIKWGKHKLSGYGYELEPVKPHKKAKWAFSLTLPENADPTSYDIKYVESQYGPSRRHDDKFVVTYYVLDTQKKGEIMVPLGFGDRRIEESSFSVHPYSGKEKYQPNVSSGRT